jgi:xanthine dehydrogenase/oxidase
LSGRAALAEVVSKCDTEGIGLSEAGSSTAAAQASTDIVVGHVGGIACAEVELDVLTGEHRVIRVDLVIDCGDTLNPMLDARASEAAFLQGYGWAVCEELVVGDIVHPEVPLGALHNCWLDTYSQPNSRCVPLDLRLTLQNITSNPVGLHGSKPVRETAFCLGLSVFFALKDAVYAARAQEGLNGFVELSAPLTCERLRMACKNELTLGSYPEHEGEDFVVPGSC